MKTEIEFSILPVASRVYIIRRDRIVSALVKQVDISIYNPGSSVMYRLSIMDEEGDIVESSYPAYTVFESPEQLTDTLINDFTE